MLSYVLWRPARAYRKMVVSSSCCLLWSNSAPSAFSNRAEVPGQHDSPGNIPLCGRAVLIVWVQSRGDSEWQDDSSVPIPHHLIYTRLECVSVESACLQVLRLRYNFSATVQSVKLYVSCSPKLVLSPCPVSSNCPYVFLLWLTCS